MKKIICILSLMIFMIFGFAACGSKLDAAFNEDKLKSASEEILDDLNNKKYDKIEAEVDDSVKDKLTADVIKKAWEPVSEKLGSYSSIDDIKITGKDDMAQVVVISKYENSKMQLTLAYNKDMKIAGLYIK